MLPAIPAGSGAGDTNSRIWKMEIALLLSLFPRRTDLTRSLVCSQRKRSCSQVDRLLDSNVAGWFAAVGDAVAGGLSTLRQSLHKTQPCQRASYSTHCPIADLKQILSRVNTQTPLLTADESTNLRALADDLNELLSRLEALLRMRELVHRLHEPSASVAEITRLLADLRDTSELFRGEDVPADEWERCRTLAHDRCVELRDALDDSWADYNGLHLVIQLDEASHGLLRMSLPGPPS